MEDYMDGIHLLIEEHKNIIKLTQIMKQECIEILEGKIVDTQRFREFIHFCREYADQHHHGKEEKILFRIMMAELGAVAEKLIRSGMLVEHDLGRYHMNELEKALVEYGREPSSVAKLEVITNASEYASLLKRHIDKEDNVAFAFAGRSLPQELITVVNRETEEFEVSPQAMETKRQFEDWLSKQSL